MLVFRVCCNFCYPGTPKHFPCPALPPCPATSALTQEMLGVLTILEKKFSNISGVLDPKVWCTLLNFHTKNNAKTPQGTQTSPPEEETRLIQDPTSSKCSNLQLSSQPSHDFCQWFSIQSFHQQKLLNGDTVDGRNPAHQLKLVV